MMRLALLLLTGFSAFAQSTLPGYDGDMAVVRVSAIKQGGSMDGFLAAITAQKAWYRSNGSAENEILVARVYEGDRKAGTAKYSDSLVLTYHLRPPASGALPNRGK